MPLTKSKMAITVVGNIHSQTKQPAFCTGCLRRFYREALTVAPVSNNRLPLDRSFQERVSAGFCRAVATILLALLLLLSSNSSHSPIHQSPIRCQHNHQINQQSIMSSDNGAYNENYHYSYNYDTGIVHRHQLPHYAPTQQQPSHDGSWSNMDMNMNPYAPYMTYSAPLPYQMRGSGEHGQVPTSGNNNNKKKNGLHQKKAMRRNSKKPGNNKHDEKNENGLNPMAVAFVPQFVVEPTTPKRTPLGPANPNLLLPSTATNNTTPAGSSKNAHALKNQATVIQKDVRVKKVVLPPPGFSAPAVVPSLTTTTPKTPSSKTTQQESMTPKTPHQDPHDTLVAPAPSPYEMPKPRAVTPPPGLLVGGPTAPAVAINLTDQHIDTTDNYKSDEMVSRALKDMTQPQQQQPQKQKKKPVIVVTKNKNAWGQQQQHQQGRSVAVVTPPPPSSKKSSTKGKPTTTTSNGAPHSLPQKPVAVAAPPRKTSWAQRAAAAAQMPTTVGFQPPPPSVPNAWAKVAAAKAPKPLAVVEPPVSLMGAALIERSPVPAATAIHKATLLDQEESNDNDDEKEASVVNDSVPRQHLAAIARGVDRGGGGCFVIDEGSPSLRSIGP